MSVRSAWASPVLLAALATGCAGPTGHFSDVNARAHVDMLARTIGSRPIGTDANRRARTYIVDHLEQYGFDVRVQEADAARPELGRTAHVFNIIAVKDGAVEDAIALVAHYDSVPEGPGAGDDAFGAAVVIEAARLLASRPQAHYSLMVLLTDGEEAGLMGAAALVEDQPTTDRVQAYINVEAIGSGGPAVLFEVGPGNGWLLTPWARRAPHPDGASFALEIYKRLPNDTDFSILKRVGLPGLNFALIGDSYAYHTARDTADRLSVPALVQTGGNVVAIVEALDRKDLTQRSAEESVYFDLEGLAGVSYGPRVGRAIAIVAVLLGLIAWLRATRVVCKTMGGVGLLVAAVCALAGFALVAAAMIGTSWALRALGDVYHPWYAHPDRLLLLLVTSGVVIGCMAVRLSTLVVKSSAGPVLVWCLTLPVWIAFAIATERLAPAASFLWTVSLLGAGLALAFAPLHRPVSVRVASIFIFIIVGTLWIRDTLQLYHFMVPVLGREPILTPVWLYPAFLLGSGVMIGPPLIAVVTGSRRRLLRPGRAAALGVAAVVMAAGLAYVAPAYTEERSLRRYVRYVQEEGTNGRFWEVGSNEASLDLAPGADQFDWRLVDAPPPVAVPVGRFRHPFVYRASAAAGTAPPAAVSARLQPRGAEVDLEVAVRPLAEGLSATFVLPPAVLPMRTNFPGVVQASGHWAATYVAIPETGIVFSATFAAAHAAALHNAAVIIRSFELPGGTGWQRLPSWLPQDRAVWQARAHYIGPVRMTIDAEAAGARGEPSTAR